MAPFDFLSAAWGIELSAKGQAEISEYAEGLDKKQVEEYIKDSDIRKLGVAGKLPKEIGRLNGAVPPGQYMVQISKIADVTQPARFQEDFEAGKWRLLSFDLTDGEQKMKGIEYVSLQKLEIGIHLAPGTKLLLYSTDKMPLKAQNGHLLLRPESVQLLGGYVEKLVEGWKASKEVEETRMLWKTEGIKKRDKAAGGPPPWVDYDPKKAPRGSKEAEQAAKAAKEEKAIWAKGVETAEAGVRKARANDDEDGGPRYKVEEFAQETTTALWSTVNKTAFQEVQKGGKGKKGEGKGKRRDKGGDDYEEEKRAPTQASCGLAAFIKPTKNGELSDAAAALVAKSLEPTSQKSASAKWDDSAWDESSWGASSWDAAGDSGWGASSWDSSGWSSGGGGGKSKGGKGGKGGGKGGGGKGGGGKSKGGKKPKEEKWW